jgi:hypothetical protein
LSNVLREKSPTVAPPVRCREAADVLERLGVGAAEPALGRDRPRQRRVPAHQPAPGFVVVADPRRVPVVPDVAGAAAPTADRGRGPVRAGAAVVHRPFEHPRGRLEQIVDLRCGREHRRRLAGRGQDMLGLLPGRGHDLGRPVTQTSFRHRDLAAWL